MKYFLSILCLAVSLIFTSCLTSATSAGSVGADRGQLLLISEKTMEESANSSYAQVLAEAKKAGKLNADAKVTARVKNIADRLIAQTTVFRADAVNWDWQVNVITDPTVNAWCMPGGKIVVYTGIIDSLKLTDGELAAVMGHEISHALKEHSREQASQSALLNLGISVTSQIVGLSNTGSSLLAMATQYGISLPFSRSHETEADHMGTELMARAGYDPYEAVNIWKKMEKLSSSKTPEIMSTHPSHGSRISDLEVIAKQVYPLYQAAIK
ncbi:MAG: M48 family metallopeptidase [Spirochaetia bacterium]|nr:M48 family metallopeptidase [Spirochaetia bacterium]